MPARSVRRRQHKLLARAAALPEGRKAEEAARLLAQWRAEARRRAGSLSLPEAWALVTPDVQARARALDRTGELLAELRRLIAEAVAEQSGEWMVKPSKPVAERARISGR